MKPTYDQYIEEIEKNDNSLAGSLEGVEYLNRKLCDYFDKTDPLEATMFGLVEHVLPTARYGFDKCFNCGKEKKTLYFAWVRTTGEANSVDWTSSHENRDKALALSLLKVLRDLEKRNVNE